MLQDSSHRTCNLCCDWDMDSSKKASHFLPPPNYPTTEHPDSPPPPPPSRNIIQNPNHFLIPVTVDYPHLIQCVKYAFWNFLKKNWNKGQTKSYLRLVGVSGNYMNEIIKLALEKREQSISDNSILNSIPIPSTARLVRTLYFLSVRFF